MDNVLYHGSKTGGIKVFRPGIHFISRNKPVVFATDDRKYALAMIYGTGNELAVSYSVDGNTGKKEIYVDELQEGKLELLEGVGYLYEVEAEHFILSPEGLESEYVSYASAPVLSETKVDNVAESLKKQGVHLVCYDRVSQSMKQRGKVLTSPEIKHDPDRFSE